MMRFFTLYFWNCWYGAGARFDAARHWWRGHDVRWRTGGEPWIGCFGDITCETCHAVFWCRHNRVWQWIARRLCARRGHPGWTHPTTGGTYHEPTGTFTGGTPVAHEWCCTRCSAWILKETEPERHA